MGDLLSAIREIFIDLDVYLTVDKRDHQKLFLDESKPGMR